MVLHVFSMWGRADHAPHRPTKPLRGPALPPLTLRYGLACDACTPFMTAEAVVPLQLVLVLALETGEPAALPSRFTK